TRRVVGREAYVHGRHRAILPLAAAARDVELVDAGRPRAEHLADLPDQPAGIGLDRLRAEGGGASQQVDAVCLERGEVDDLNLVTLDDDGSLQILAQFISGFVNHSLLPFRLETMERTARSTVSTGTAPGVKTPTIPARRCTVSASFLVQEHGLSENVAHLWPVFGDVVQLAHIDALDAAGDGAHGNVGVGTVAQGHHTPADAARDERDRQVGIVDADHEIERVGRTGAHEVGDLLIDDVLAGQLLERLAGELADAAQLLVAIRVGLAVLDDLAAQEVRAFADGDHGVIARVGLLVLDDQLCQLLDVEGHLGDEG